MTFARREQPRARGALAVAEHAAPEQERAAPRAEQRGRFNEAGAAQFGTNHNSIIIQDGRGNIAAGVQVGNGCDAEVRQNGSGNVAAFVQTCR